MITLFTTPRPFEGHYDTIQTNAFRSWALMEPRPERIVVFADREHEGDKAVDLSLELGCEVLPIKERSPRGVPLLSDLFPRAQELGGTPCYLNADIIIIDDLVTAIETVNSQLKKECLMICRRWNVQVLSELEFADGWKDALMDKVEEQGSLMVECAMDLFAWTPGLYSVWKPYAIGRYLWDNHLAGLALVRGGKLVDLTPSVRIIHQTHAQVPWNDPDHMDVNRKIPSAYCGAKDSTHTLVPGEGLVNGWRG